jgi:hypothetical protein
MFREWEARVWQAFELFCLIVTIFLVLLNLALPFKGVLAEPSSIFIVTSLASL